MKYQPNVAKRSSLHTMVAMDKIPYAITIKYLRKDKVFYAEDYVLICDYLELLSNGRLDGIRYEIDKNDKLHLHGTLWASPYFRYTSLQKKGYHILFKKIFEKEGWIKYTLKDSNCAIAQSMVLESHYYRNNYGFVTA